VTSTDNSQLSGSSTPHHHQGSGRTTEAEEANGAKEPVLLEILELLQDPRLQAEEHFAGAAFDQADQAGIACGFRNQASCERRILLNHAATAA